MCQLAASDTMLPFAMCFLLGKGIVLLSGLWIHILISLMSMVYTNTLLSRLVYASFEMGTP